MQGKLNVFLGRNRDRHETGIKYTSNNFSYQNHFLTVPSQRRKPFSKISILLARSLGQPSEKISNTISPWKLYWAILITTSVRILTHSLESTKKC